MTTLLSRRTLASLILLTTCLAAPAAGQDYVLADAVATTTRVVTYQVPPSGGTIPLTFVRSESAPAAVVTVSVTALRSEAGDRIEPSLTITSQGGPRIVVPSTSDRVVACELVVPAPSGPGPYTGNLYLWREGREVLRQPVTIVVGTPARPAALQLIPASDSRTFTMGLPFWRQAGPPAETLDLRRGPTFDVRLGDAAELWPVTAVRPGPITVTKGPAGLSASEHVAFYDAERRLVTFPRDVPAAGETLTMQLRDVSAGEYQATVPFHANNAALEPHTFTFTATVRHGVAWAVACLSLAILLSFAGSKLVEIRQERWRLVRRIDELSPRWFDEEEETFAIVWISSVLSQARTLSRTWMLPSLDTVHARLDRAQALLQRIGQLRRVRAEIAEAVLPPLARRRALKIAERLADRLDPDMDAAALTEHTNAITELRGWTRAGEVESRYAADLTQSLNQLLLTVDVQAVPATGQTIVGKLVEQLTPPLPADFRQLDACEQKYAKLQILWSRRKAPEFETLVKKADGTLEEVFAAADQAAWARLERATGRRLTHSGGMRVDAYEPLRFAFSSGDTDLDDTYLVRHRLRYEWSFLATPKKGMPRATPKDSTPFRLQPSTSVPRVPQDAPFKGTLNPSVTLVFPGSGTSALTVAGEQLRVSRSRQFATMNAFSPGEIIQFALAFTAAVITGLQTFYYKAGGFGSLPDYLALFAWGATIDQLKNFLQKLPAATPSVQGAVVSESTALPGAGAGAAPARVLAAPPRPTALALNDAK